MDGLAEHYRDGQLMALRLLAPGRESAVVLDRLARDSWAGVRSEWGRNPFYRAYHLGFARRMRQAGYGR